MIFGGLEIVAGGYFAHKYFKNRNDKKRTANEAHYQQPPTIPINRPSTYPLRPHFQHQEQHTHYHHHPQHVSTPLEAHAFHAPAPFHPQSQNLNQSQPHQLRPKPTHAQTFHIPRRPLPQHKPALIIQPALQRADSMATLSRMPVANGYRPSNQTELVHSPPQQSPYSTSAFAASAPAFGTAAAVHTTNDDDDGGRWAAPCDGRDPRYSSHYAPSVSSTMLGERDPPPPYVP